MTEVQKECFDDWRKKKYHEIYPCGGKLEDMFLKFCKDPACYTSEFVRGWEYGSGVKTGLIDTSKYE